MYMPSRRAVLVGAGGLVAVGGAVFGTGAFSNVQAERTVTVSTAGDRSGILGLEPIPDSDNGRYATIIDGTLEVTIPDVNPDAISRYHRVFQVTNNGTQAVVLYLEEVPGDRTPDDNAVDFGVLAGQLVDAAGEGSGNPEVVDISSQSPPDRGSGYDDIGVLLESGETLEVGVYIDTSGTASGGGGDGDGTPIGAGDLAIAGLVVHATATEVGNEAYTAAGGG